MSELKEQSTEAKSYLLAIGLFVIAAIGMSSLFVIGYTRDMPREAFLVFGQHLSLTIGIEAGFAAAFSLVTAKAILVLISVKIALVGGVLTGFKNGMLERAAKKTDEGAIRIATAPLRAVLPLAFARHTAFSFCTSLLPVKSHACDTEKLKATIDGIDASDVRDVLIILTALAAP